MDAPGLHDRLKARLALVRADLDEVVARFDDSLLDWAPRDGMRTVAGQLQEIACTEVQLMTWIRESRLISYQEAMSFDPVPASIADYRTLLAKIRADTMTYMDSLTAEELETPVPFPEKWFEALRLPQVGRSEAFRSLAQHEWYHTGQLVSYAWSRGDDPYDW